MGVKVLAMQPQDSSPFKEMNLKERPQEPLVTTKNNYLSFSSFQLFSVLKKKEKSVILERIGRTVCWSNLKLSYKILALSDEELKNFYIQIGALIYSKKIEAFQKMVTPFVRNYFSNHAPSVIYFGQAKISTIIAGYLGPNEEGLTQKADFVEHVFTLSDPNTKKLKNPLDIMWALGEYFWLQIIDGKYHYLNNPNVFDEGAHPPGQCEPGFYASMKKGCIFASMHFSEFPSPLLYQMLHRELCSHFPAKKFVQRAFGVLMSAQNAGIYRKQSDICVEAALDEFFSLKTKEPFSKLSLAELADDAAKYKSGLVHWDFLSNSSKSVYANEANFEEHFQRAVRLTEIMDAKISEINAYIVKRSRELGVETIAVIERHLEMLRVDYTCPPEQIPLAVENVFKQFKTNMAAADTKDKKIRCIADLYQLLEWIHPFPDGQGRVDLVQLATLLSKYGINPSILMEPYFSTTSTFEEWEQYLKDGIIKWQDKYCQIRSGSAN